MAIKGGKNNATDAMTGTQHRMLNTQRKESDGVIAVAEGFEV
jgi:hypothetical protein